MNITIFDGKIHYFNGHCPVRYVAVYQGVRDIFRIASGQGFFQENEGERSKDPFFEWINLISVTIFNSELLVISRGYMDV